MKCRHGGHVRNESSLVTRSRLAILCSIDGLEIVDDGRLCGSVRVPVESNGEKSKYSLVYSTLLLYP